MLLSPPLILLLLDYGSGAEERKVLAPLGSSLSLLCDPLLRDEPNATAHWFHNDAFIGQVVGDRNLELVPNSQAAAPEEPSIGLLVISRVDKVHAGNYFCRTSGGEQSEPIFVDVAYLDEDFALSPGWHLGRIGLPLHLHCRPPRGNPRPSVHWLKDGRRLSAGSLDLILRGYQSGDEGRYTCVAQNSAGRRVADGFVAPPHLLPSWGFAEDGLESDGCRCSRVSLFLWFLAGAAVSGAAIAAYSLCLLVCCPGTRFKRRRWVIQGSLRGSNRDPAFLPASHVLRPLS